MSSHGASLKWWQRLPQPAQKKSQAMRSNSASCYEFDGKSTETETQTWSEFPNRGKAIIERILAAEERYKSKRAGLGESQSGIQVGKLIIWLRSISSTRIG